MDKEKKLVFSTNSILSKVKHSSQLSFIAFVTIKPKWYVY